MNNKTAIIFGATGLTGSLLLNQLTDSGYYSSIKIFVRKPTGIINSKIEEIISDFQNLSDISQKITGDDLYICLGTTIKKAGTIANVEKADRDLPVNISSIASSNGIKKIAVVSSLGADSHSSNYYLRVKGEMEEGIMKQYFSQIVFARPSLLIGNRDEKRFGESAGKIFMKIINPLLAGNFKKYRSIQAKDVAKAMIVILRDNIPGTIFESDKLQKLSALH